MVPKIHLVEFRKPTETNDAAGAAVITYQLQFRAVVSFRIDQDRLTTEGDIRPSGRVTARIRMPYIGTIDRGWRVTYDGQDYDVETVRDPFGDRKDLELTVVAIEQ